MARNETERLDDGELSAAPSDRRHEQMGEGGGGQRRQQTGECQRQALDPPEVHDVVGLVRRNYDVGRSERRHRERQSGPR